MVIGLSQEVVSLKILSKVNKEASTSMYYVNYEFSL